ncbi:signal transduction histidine kinase [Kibdelosporangium banguiense]|uniref:Signal transduction histidine kinase n=1 Tax=Kibdelosporangium banguiense TaxID=1365924 RepID=A0ABS4TLD0_9PSEU|nr:histidine kinase [Kibdelosporangium banguiense]MBP2325139.1 signal transduction histidine kinase [Kibdelosporangium banguiense]
MDPDAMAGLLAESRRREAWLLASNEITATLLASDGTEDELRLIAAHAREVAGAPFAAIALPDEDQPGVLVFHVVVGVERLEGATISVEGTASGLVYSSGEAYLIDQYGDAAASWQGDDGDVSPGDLKGLGSAAIVPLKAGTDTLGVLLLCRRREEPLFGPADLELLRNFAAHAALALRYATARADQQRLVVFEDRDRIARDLHDLVIQRVFATGMALEAAAAIVPVDPDDASARIRQAVDDLDETIQEIRTTVFALQAPPEESLRSQVLEAANYATTVLGFPPSVRFLGPVDTTVSPTTCEQLLPVLREALSNVARHAQASAVAVEIAAGEDLLLRVIDNGVGMPSGGRRSGVANMAVRARRLGGTFNTVPANPGTELRWRVPLR